MKKQVGRVRKPNALLYYGACIIFRAYYRIFYGHRIDKSALGSIKPPYLVVAGHSSWLDYVITSVTMFPVRMNYVGAYNFFRDRLLKTVFNIMGVIPKYQFTNDITAVKRMKSVINRGGVVAIFPNGCLSNEGRPGGFAVFGIAKLIRYLNVPVVALRTDGGYLTRPRWTRQPRFGRMETKATQILSPRNIQSLSDVEIYRRVTRSLAFDDYEWQRQRMIPFRSRKVAEGVEFVLYKCPKCAAEFRLRSYGNRLFCESCGNAVIMNKYMLFEPENENTVYFDGIDKWFDYQYETIDGEIVNPCFKLTAETELKCAESGKYGYQHLGFGTVRLTREEIVYEGTVNGEKKVIIYPMKNIPMVPYAAGEYIEIARGSDISRFVFADLRMQIKWVMAIRRIRDTYYESRNGKAESDFTLDET